MSRAQRIVELREHYRAIAAELPSSKSAVLVDLVCELAVVSSRVVEERLDVTRPTALKLLRQLEAIGVLSKTRPGPRGRLRYAAHDLIALLADESDAGDNE